ncbi:hypothetical protein GCM10017600_67900 [Streptosporangium carneum]|uniref:Uncharacterized protein n=1 Tax=Streptosporangium carneum TaxID=47481 RepID=A0A9W6I900_9ACTN|nr:hypothetical protein GCM10017600_67900 [Streptosporangium carneum]
MGTCEVDGEKLSHARQPTKQARTHETEFLPLRPEEVRRECRPELAEALTAPVPALDRERTGAGGRTRGSA